MENKTDRSYNTRTLKKLELISGQRELGLDTKCFIKGRKIFCSSPTRDSPRYSGFEPARNMSIFLFFLLSMGRHSTYTGNKFMGHYLHGAIVERTQVVVHAENYSFLCNTSVQRTRPWGRKKTPSHIVQRYTELNFV